jgi:3-methyladenine DNA glycosylase AlkD
VDASAPYILGEHLKDKDRAPLYTLARSEGLWDRRIAIVATLALIRANDFGDTLRVSELLLNDPRDLIHKACGWMLREAGKRDEKALKGFLDRFRAQMPRTMLRYAIERFPEGERRRYLSL